MMPGDVFHLYFHHYHLVYFDISIRNTTQPSFIYSSVSWAGVAAAAAGEAAKDKKHLAAVEKVGSGFIPLVVETFGFWTPFALKQLLADLTTPCSGVPRKIATVEKNLLQQLLVQLWVNIAKIIMVLGPSEHG